MMIVIPEKYDAYASYQPENDAGHVAYNQAKHDCHRKCTELIAQLDLKLTHVTSPVLDMEGCMQNCDEFNAYGWKR
ncbi:Hypothetical predicted protein [Mytilus galloprovincialis]|uniref:Uncharacterized protein n=1 Tax=Mytilus galloprovincialis TaxID=29158 RepID=A0A8B6FJA5_MYTGA|nr:Hypothetical predicted protein [Mytilus galloprovincialis]